VDSELKVGMDGAPLRVGILGAGGITERAMVEPAREVPGVEVVAIGSRDPERARALAERLDVPEAGDYEAILSHPGIDLVYVALPPVFHAQWATRALRAGKHVLCEKPLSANEAGARAIAQAAAAVDRRAFVGFHYRLHGFTQRLLEVIGSGVLGSVEEVAFDFSIPDFVVQPGNIRLDGDLGGGAVMDVGCYAVDLVRAAWGDPQVVSSTAVLSQDDPRVDLQTDAELELPDGAPVHLRASFLGQGKGSMSLQVTGSTATLDATSVIVPQWGAELRVTSPEGLLVEARAEEGESSYVRQLEHLADVLRDGSPSLLDAGRAVGTMKVVDDIYRASGLEPR
jgi:predicted dehydrogenase